MSHEKEEETDHPRRAWPWRWLRLGSLAPMKLRSQMMEPIPFHVNFWELEMTWPLTANSWYFDRACTYWLVSPAGWWAVNHVATLPLVKLPSIWFSSSWQVLQRAAKEKKMPQNPGPFTWGSPAVRYTPNRSQIKQRCMCLLGIMLDILGRKGHKHYSPRCPSRSLAGQKCTLSLFFSVCDIINCFYKIEKWYYLV